MKPTYTFETFQGRNGDWYWRVTHRNGNIVAAAGEGYRRRGTAVRSAQRLFRAAAGIDFPAPKGGEDMAKKGGKKGKKGGGC